MSNSNQVDFFISQSKVASFLAKSNSTNWSIIHFVTSHIQRFQFIKIKPNQHWFTWTPNFDFRLYQQIFFYWNTKIVMMIRWFVTKWTNRAKPLYPALKNNIGKIDQNKLTYRINECAAIEVKQNAFSSCSFFPFISRSVLWNSCRPRMNYISNACLCANLAYIQNNERMKEGEKKLFRAFD